MAARELEAQVLRKNRPEGEFALTADPGNPAELREALQQYLKGNKWSPARWDEFKMTVRQPGTWKALATVRAA